MAVDLEKVLQQLTDSGIISPKRLEPFIPPHAHPESVEELVRELVKKQQLTRFQATQIAAGKAKALLLGNYILVDKIGAGGMGQVFKAVHRRMKRIVALKTLPANSMKDEETIARFQREAEAAAKLRHPNIVAADDADEANGTHFLVMEFVDGQDLSAYVKENGVLTIDRAIDVLLQAARGLEFAHKKKVVHRDIKPSNLLLDQDGTVKILDMGLARIESEGSFVTRTELTETGTMMGTVDYVAPEQAVDSKKADSRADIYSLGCTLFYLLTGRATYSGQSMMAKLLAHRDSPIPWLTEYRDDIPDDLDEVFQKMIAKLPENRYQTMTEVIEDLEKVQQRLSKSAKGKPKLVKSPDKSTTIPKVEIATEARTQGVTVGLDSMSQTRWSTLQKLAKTGSGKLMIAAACAVIALVLVAVIVLLMMTGSSATARKTGQSTASPNPTEQPGQATAPASGVTAANATPPVVVAESKFVSLLNGRDLSGWTPVGNPDCWKFVSGAIVATEKPGSFNWLLTDREYGDFILRCEYVLDAGANSGIAVLAQPDDTRVLEIQISDVGTYPTGGFWSSPHINDPRSWTKPDLTGKDRPPGELNQFEMTLKSRVLTVSLNGSEVSRYQLAEMASQPDSFPSLQRTSGRIGLQAQSKQVKFYNLRIAELSPAATLKAKSNELKSYEWPAKTPRSAIAPFDSLTASRHQQEWAEHLKIPVNFTNKLGMKFRLIPPGEFIMGSTTDEIERSLDAIQEFGSNALWSECVRNESPQHKVVITRPFYMAICEVTQDEFQQVMGRNSSYFSPEGPGKDRVKGVDSNRFPVDRVSWNDANEFCKRLNLMEFPGTKPNASTTTSAGTVGYRLPTEAEWEFATRAGTTTRHWRGDDDAALSPAEWYRDNAGARTHAVAELPSNPFGLYDTLGNVFEWVQDAWAPGYYQESTGKLSIDPIGPLNSGSERIFRGGDWYTRPILCRAAHRRAADASQTEHIIGFRIVLPCASAASIR